MKKPIICKAMFYSPEEGMSEDLQEILGEDTTTWEDYCFDLEEVSSFNRTSDGVYTCLRMKNGFDVNVNIEFDKMIKQ